VAQAGAYEDFFKAIEIDNPRMLSALLERGFDPNTLDARGQHGLYLALRDGSVKTEAVLLAHPATQSDSENSVGETPLMMAALRGRLDASQRLLDRGARVNKDGWTPLHYAASGPEIGVVKLLLERGAKVDALAPNGSTPLMMAARDGAIDAVPLLLAHGADPKLRNTRGLSAADFARNAGRDALAFKLDAATR
jgi:ankyrin repeat protein